jgi:hypothetical protein
VVALIEASESKARPLPAVPVGQQVPCSAGKDTSSRTLTYRTGSVHLGNLKRPSTTALTCAACVQHPVQRLAAYKTLVWLVPGHRCIIAHTAHATGWVCTPAASFIRPKGAIRLLRLNLSAHTLLYSQQHIRPRPMLGINPCYGASAKRMRWAPTTGSQPATHFRFRFRMRAACTAHAVCRSCALQILVWGGQLRRQARHQYKQASRWAGSD